jgi:hypothetical protein
MAQMLIARVPIFPACGVFRAEQTARRWAQVQASMEKRSVVEEGCRTRAGIAPARKVFQSVTATCTFSPLSAYRSPKSSVRLPLPVAKLLMKPRQPLPLIVAQSLESSIHKLDHVLGTYACCWFRSHYDTLQPQCVEVAKRIRSGSRRLQRNAQAFASPAFT